MTGTGWGPEPEIEVTDGAGRVIEEKRWVNPLAWVADGLKVWPEPPTGPEWLDEISLLELAEARSRLSVISRVATELRKTVDARLVEVLDGAAFRYGETILRAAGRKGRPTILDPKRWWALVVRALRGTPNPEGLLEVLYPANAVRLTGFPALAAALGEDPEELRREHLEWEPPSSPLSEIPIYKAAKYLQDLPEGKTTYDRPE